MWMNLQFVQHLNLSLEEKQNFICKLSDLKKKYFRFYVDIFLISHLDISFFLFFFFSNRHVLIELSARTKNL